MSKRLFRLFVFASALLPIGVSATTRTWPGVAPCAGTLQACVNGATDGDRIEIATSTPIAEDLSLYDRSLTLTAADGYAPAFGTNHWLSITSSAIAGDLQVSISRLSFNDGYVFANYNGAGTANYDLRDLTLARVSSDVANYIEVDASAGTINATLYGNRLSGVPRSIDRGLIQLNSGGATLNANAYYNHVTSTSATGVRGAGIFVDVHASSVAAGGGTFKLHGNEVRGGFFRSGIFISEGLFSNTASSVVARVYNNVAICADASSAGTGGSGIGFVANNGSIDAQAINNTVSRCYYGIMASQWSGGGAGASIAGTFKNNILVAYNGLALDPSVPGARTNDYNLINSTAASVSYGSHTSTAPASLVLDTQPRLRADSPAIDAADGVTLGFGLLLNGLPTTDADGLRRFKGTRADIGAYESGDANFTQVARSNTILGNSSVIDNAALNSNSGRALIATPNYNVGLFGGVDYDHPFGAYYPAPYWWLFNQDATLMPPGAHFDVFVPASGGGSFIHTSSASNTGGLVTTLSNGSVDSLPDRIVLVTQNWTAGGSALYNPHPIGVYYDVDARWHIANIDGATMPQPVGFNVYAQEPSPNAFRVTATSANLFPGGAVRLDHPLLDNTPCARPQVTRGFSFIPVVRGNFDVYYGVGNKWYIFGYSGVSLGEQFHVLIDPAQVFTCTDSIFADGFQ